MIDPATIIAIDTSVVISLDATGCAGEVLRAIPNKVMIVDVVLRDLEGGRPLGRRVAHSLRELAADGLLEIGKLNDAASLHFERLVVGSAAMTLDDGEAATIAFAVASAGMAVVDEPKAAHICAKLFPHLSIECTVGLLAQPSVGTNLGNGMLATAVFKAIQDGRMRVFPQYVEWVVNVIGQEQAVACARLSKFKYKLQQF